VKKRGAHPRRRGETGIRIDVLIRSLGAGGAERQAALLAAGLAARGHDLRVLVFYPGGANEAYLRDRGVPVRHLGKRSRWDIPRLVAGLARELRIRRPDVIYSLLPSSNVIAALARPFLPATAVAMGVRASDMDLRKYDPVSGAVYRLEARVARAADVVITNSAAGRRTAIGSGFPEDRVRVVPNGIDCDRFRPDEAARESLRRRLGVPGDALLIGMVARVDPMKDHVTFLEAARRLSRLLPAARFAFAGTGAGPSDIWLRREIGERGLREASFLLGEVADIETVYPALDIASLTSAFGEGFPNALGEAMACGVPCVATSVGDAAEIVGDTGRIVRPRDPDGLVEAWRALGSLTPAARIRLGETARNRIIAFYGASRMVDETERHLATIAARATQADPV
jgi:glycosyltransferase involved in cell wall biosynthesis